MSIKSGKFRTEHGVQLWRYFSGAVVAWTLAVSCVLWWAVSNEKQHYVELAEAQALERYEGCLASLDPANMSVNIHEMQRRDPGRWGRIVSLNPLNPANKPDDWELRHLRDFEKGMLGHEEEITIDGKMFSRYMGPVWAKDECLVCHESQGYQKGSVMGGINVSVPLDPYFDAWRMQARSIAQHYAALWVAGLLGITLTGSSLYRKMKENRSARQALLESEARFAAIANSVRDALLMMNSSGQVVFCNRAFETIFGWTESEVVNLDLHTILAPEGYRDAFHGGIGGFIETGQGPAVGRTLELTALRKGGEEFPIEVSLSSVQFAGGWHAVGLIRDITERKKAEESLHRIYLRESLVNEILGLSVTDYSIEEVLQWSLQLVLALPGFPFKESGGVFLIDEKTNALVLTAHHRLNPAAVKGCARIRSGECLCGRALALGEVQIASTIDERHTIRYEGMEPHGHCCVPMRAGGRTIGVLNLYLEEGGLQSDMVEFLMAVASALGEIVVRHEMTAATRQSEVRYRSLFQSSDDAIMTLEPPTWQFTSGNPACIAMFGVRDKEHFKSIGPWDVAPERQPDGRISTEKAKEMIGNAMRDGSCLFDWIHQRMDGRQFPATVLITRVSIDDHTFLQATVRDVSKQRQMEMELTQAQKLESVGRLAAGIAHEINTPTQYVGDNIEFLQVAYESLADLAKSFPEVVEASTNGPLPAPLLAQAKSLLENTNFEYLAEQVPRAIEQSLEGVGRIAGIVQAMKEFSHPGVASKTSVDLNQCIRSTATVSRNEWKYVAELELDLEDSLPHVLCLPGEFNQAILNMIVNASHAISDVLGENAETKGKITVSSRADGDWVEVRVSDSGSGIPQEIRERIFDPFFTTKEVGRGTGQGLAIARNVIVDKHGGALMLESEVGKGTTFIIRLPITS